MFCGQSVKMSVDPLFQSRAIRIYMLNMMSTPLVFPVYF